MQTLTALIAKHELPRQTRDNLKQDVLVVNALILIVNMSRTGKNKK